MPGRAALEQCPAPSRWSLLKAASFTFGLSSQVSPEGHPCPDQMQERPSPLRSGTAGAALCWPVSSCIRPAPTTLTPGPTWPGQLLDAWTAPRAATLNWGWDRGRGLLSGVRGARETRRGWAGCLQHRAVPTGIRVPGGVWRRLPGDMAAGGSGRRGGTGGLEADT